MEIFKIFKKILPLFIINFLRRYKNYLVKKKFAKMNTQEVFKSIYQNQLWTPDEDKKKFQFYSGTGSHEEEVVKIYLKTTTL